MKLLRFMSITELEKFRAGELLENTTNHHAQNGNKTDSEGFCFLDYDEHDEQYAYHFLSGVVSTEICAVFEVDDIVAKKGLTKGEGRFATPGGSFFESMMVTEYSTKRYSNQNMELLKFCDDFNGRLADNDYDRIFEFKAADAPIKKRISIVDKNPVPRPPKPATPEQHLLDAIESFVRHMSPSMPAEFFDGFTLSAAPSMNYERSFSGDKLTIEGLEFTRRGGLLGL